MMKMDIVRMKDFILAIDQGTTSTRSIIFDGLIEAVVSAKRVQTTLPEIGLGGTRGGRPVDDNA